MPALARVIGALALLLGSSAHAALYVPTRFDDPLPGGCLPTDCSLREAIIAANGNRGFDSIELKAGTYSLTRGGSGDTPQVADLDVTDALRIFSTGSSANTFIQNTLAEASSVEARVIEVKFVTRFELSGVTLRYGRMHQSNMYPWGGCLYFIMGTGAQPVLLEDVVVANCKSHWGGGVASIDSTVFDRVTVRNNSAAKGGGIWQAGGTSSWRQVQIKDNVAAFRGGGLFVDGAGTSQTVIDADAASAITGNLSARGGGIAVAAPNKLWLRGPEEALPGNLIHVFNNEAEWGGGAFAAPGTELRLDGARLELNRADIGGGVLAQAPLYITNSELRENIAVVRGGGIYSTSLTVDLQRVSLVGNEAMTGGGMFGMDAYNVLVRNVSVHNNRAHTGAGLYLLAPFGTGALENLSMQGNVASAGDGSDGLLFQGLMLQLAANWFGDGCLVASGSVNSSGGNAQRTGTPSCSLPASDPGFFTAAEAGVTSGWYGGRFDILGFKAGASLLEDRVAAGACAPEDARDFLRLQPKCDIGAYEAAGVAP
jgi:hypothetical protein